jgi:hypothetical protein
LTEACHPSAKRWHRPGRLSQARRRSASKGCRHSERFATDPTILCVGYLAKMCRRRLREGYASLTVVLTRFRIDLSF